MRSSRSTAALALLPLALAFLLYFPTLRLSWAYDDIDYINQAADALSGHQSFSTILLRPQGEHIVAGFRLILFASLKLCGASAAPYRTFVLVVHALSGFFLGLIARRYSSGPSGAETGSQAAGLAAGALYVGACGFSSMWVWYPSGATVPFAMALLTGATAALAYRVPHARLVAGAAVVAALFTESTLVPMAALPMLIDEWERWRQGRWSVRRPIGLFSVFCAAVAVGVAGLVSVLYTRTFGPHLSISIRHGVPRAAFLLLAAPFRLFFPGILGQASEPGLRTGILGALVGLVVASCAGALLLVLWRRGAPRLAGVALLAAAGPAGAVLLVGLGRWRSSYWDLYEADRYFFTLLVPLSLLAGAVAMSLAEPLRAWPRRARAALLLLLAVAGGAELVLHRRAVLGRIPTVVYDIHARRFAQLALLARRLEAAADALPPGSPPLEVPDAPLWFPDVHNGQLTTRVLMEVVARRSARLRLGGPVVSARDERVLNPVLAAWGREIGEPLPYLSVAGGRLRDEHMVPFVDFRTGPEERAVLGGFYAWEGNSRWMGGTGELRFNLTSPSLALVAGTAGEAVRSGPLEIAVQVLDEAGGFAVDLEPVRLDRGGLQVFHLSTAPYLSKIGAGRVVHLRLRSSRTWIPAKTLPGSPDTRELSIMVFAAGSE